MMLRKKKAFKLKQLWRRKDPSDVASTSAPLPPPPPWLELPLDITANILQRLGAIEILESAQKVCRTWRIVCQDPAMWRKIDMSEDMPFDMEIMCKHTVDRSQGQLVEIKIGYFGTNELLKYVAERAGQLKCLWLAFCDGISGEGLSAAITRFPLLEELHLFVISVPYESIEIVGHSCLLLNSFTLNKRGYKVSQAEFNKEAFAIAKTMPGLRHLRLFGNEMTDEGLQAILDGCAHLESLDLRQCYSVNIYGDVGRRCSLQIKYVRPPDDSTADYQFDAEIDTDSFNGYPSGFSDLDLMSDYDEYYVDYDDHWNLDSDSEDFFGFLLVDGKLPFLLLYLVPTVYHDSFRANC